VLFITAVAVVAELTVSLVGLPAHKTAPGSVETNNGPTLVGIKLIVALAELTALQPLLCTTTLYKVVWAILVTVNVLVVLAIGTHVVPPSTEDSQPTIFPIFPLNVSVVELVPKQALMEAGERVPPTVTAVVVNVATALVSDDAHILVIYTLYFLPLSAAVAGKV
jgi:hypothetical protein